MQLLMPEICHVVCTRLPNRRRRHFGVVDVRVDRAGITKRLVDGREIGVDPVTMGTRGMMRYLGNPGSVGVRYFPCPGI